MTLPAHRPRRTLRAETITLAHGAGGKAMRDLIDDVFVGGFANDTLAQLEDQARFDLDGLLKEGDKLAMTTDSYVVDPLFFPGGDIGKLAVAGTVNDLAVGGATPLYLSCGMIIEEGLPVETLRRVVASMKATADAAGVQIVTGDTKVVHKGAADKLFINTAGVGVIPKGVDIAAHRARPGDVVVINGFIGDHGAAIADARGEMALESNIETDCQALNGLIEAMLAVRAACELLGLDPLYLANEGKLVAVIPAGCAEAVLQTMRAHPAGEHSARIGEVGESPAGAVILKTGFGGQRIVDMLVGEQLPRIC